MRLTALSVIGHDVDSVLANMIDRIDHVERVRRLSDLRPLLERRLDRPFDGATLDLLGHSTRGPKLLRLGETVIDMFDPEVEAVFEGFARDRLLERIGIRTLRLLGCRTALRPVGQRTMRRLASTLGVPVFGTTKNLMKSHFGPGGFRPAFSRCLVEAAQLPRGLALAGSP